MKLIRLNIQEEFRSLVENFEINFRDPVKDEHLLHFHPFCFAGLNGSGKSNVLEALSNIFYHLECIVNDYPVFAYESKESNPDIFELEYFIAKENSSNSIDSFDHILIRKDKDSSPIMSVNYGEAIPISKTFGKSYIPDLIVAYSSGENETLSLPFVKMKLFQYDQYIKDLKDNVKFEKPKSSLLYIDYEMSQAVLLTIMLFFDFKTEDGKAVLDLLKDEIKIGGMHEFTLNLHNNWQALLPNSNYSYLEEVETIFNKNNKENQDKNYIGKILDNLEEYISKFKDCATCSYENGSYIAHSFLVDENTIDLIRAKFENDPYKFFSFFQILHSLNERVEENIYKAEVYNSKGFYTDYKKPDYNHVFYFTHYYIKKVNEDKTEFKLLLRQLSDGEQQFLHTLGICLMLQKKRTLLLLDEPETHFNPDWRSKFINILRKTLEAGKDNFLFKDVLLTSHSPFIISDCFPDRVIVFDKGKQPKNAMELNIDTFGTSVNIITNKIFKKKNTIGEYSFEKLGEYKEQANSENVNKIIEQINEELGDSIEKMLLIKELKDKFQK